MMKESGGSCMRHDTQYDTSRTRRHSNETRRTPQSQGRRRRRRRNQVRADTRDVRERKTKRIDKWRPTDEQTDNRRRTPPPPLSPPSPCGGRQPRDDAAAAARRRNKCAKSTRGPAVGAYAAALKLKTENKRERRSGANGAKRGEEGEINAQQARRTRRGLGADAPRRQR